MWLSSLLPQSNTVPHFIYHSPKDPFLNVNESLTMILSKIQQKNAPLHTGNHSLLGLSRGRTSFVNRNAIIMSQNWKLSDFSSALISYPCPVHTVKRDQMSHHKVQHHILPTYLGLCCNHFIFSGSSDHPVIASKKDHVNWYFSLF